VRQFVDNPPASMRAVRDLLGVDLVVEGSVQVRGDRCRITVQLIDARRDVHLWARTYDRDLTDVFDVQSDVALQIARALEAELSPREHQRLRRPPTNDFRAWQLYLKGRELWARRSADTTAHAASLFERALEIDTHLAPAWVGLADVHLSRIGFGGTDATAEIHAAKRAIQYALRHHPESGEAHATLGLIHTFFESDPVAAETEYRRAVEYNPGYATAHQWYGNWLCTFGRPQQGLTELGVAVDLDPLSPVVSDSLALALLHLGRTDEAESQFRHTLELDPAFWRSRFGLAVCFAHRADLTSATAQLVAVWQAGGWNADPGDAPRAARLLERDARDALEHLANAAHAIEGPGAIRMAEIVLLMLLDRPLDALARIDAGGHRPWLGFLILYAPVLDPLARHARFRAAMSRVGLLLPRWRGRD
jgi:tetratricopeptide (TPR) repeat protein